MRYILFIFLIMTGFLSYSQVNFEAKISKDAVMVYEPFVLEFEVNQNFDDFKLPDLENFKLISGPNTSMQQSINMVNGEMTKKISVKYTYFVKALTAGKLTIQSAEIKIGKDFHYSNSIDVIVIDMEYTDPNQNKGKDIKGTEKI